jgi:uncharacterized membrane protein YccC
MSNEVVKSAGGTFLGIVLAVVFFFIVLPVASCVGCAACAAIGAAESKASGR